MLRLVYSTLFYLAIPLVLLRLLWRSRREPLYRATLGQRFGYTRKLSAPGLVWIHSVSAGETNAAAPLARRLVDKGHPVIITTMTPTGRERVGALFGDTVYHSYAPYDMPDAMNRFLSRTQPAVLVIIDTELWPNMIHYAHRRGTKTLLVNARLSEKSARGYAMVRPLVAETLRELDMVAVQTEAHGRRFVSLGLPLSKLDVAGSIKFDFLLPEDLDERAAQLKSKIGERRVILAASTHPGEDEAVLEQFLAMKEKDVLLILAPRHPHRASAVEQLCKTKGLQVVRHSAGTPCDNHIDVLLVDTMGELMYFYR
ncbi:MAG TPA: 3-deoxy-D-manno-octulosonic acid transferase, partial [Pseudomonadales bacterium]|nr:3-deoxy-D-manno-octulosonic acid transferase [Pseudomonadales bacterium]